jgi:CBS domain containing-hemolysin-like protein
MLEEIVGEIRDEYDEDEEDEITMLGDDACLVSGSMKLDDLNDRLGLKLSSEDYDSVGGLMIGLLDHLPEEGETVEYEGLRLCVEHMEKNRIDKIRLQLIIPPTMPPAAQQASTVAAREVSGSDPCASTTDAAKSTAK